MASFESTIVEMCRSGHHFHVPQTALLLTCYRQGGEGNEAQRQVKALAEYLGVSKPMITRTADTFCEQGLLERSHLSTDARTCVLSLTRRGEDLVERLLAKNVALKPRRN